MISFLKFIGVDQRAIFFALLNPQPNGAGFAGKFYKFITREKNIYCHEKDSL